MRVVAIFSILTAGGPISLSRSQQACAPAASFREGDCHEPIVALLVCAACRLAAGTSAVGGDWLLRLPSGGPDRSVRTGRSRLSSEPPRRRLRRRQLRRLRLVRTRKGLYLGLQMGLRRDLLGRVVERSARLLRPVRRLWSLDRPAGLLPGRRAGEDFGRVVGLPRRTVFGRRVLRTARRLVRQRRLRVGRLLVGRLCGRELFLVHRSRFVGSHGGRGAVADDAGRRSASSAAGHAEAGAQERAQGQTTGASLSPQLHASGFVQSVA